MDELLRKDEVFRVVGAAMAVYNELGPGFLEAVYQEALEIEFADRNIPFTPQQEMLLSYKGRRLRKTYIADFVVFGGIIIEIKAIDRLTSREQAQLLNYLKATGREVGVLINFCSHDKLEWKRMALSKR